MHTSKSYTLTKVKQLIDLNGDAVNFQVQFTVQSEGGKPFLGVITSQQALDSNEQLAFRESINGIFSGNIVADKNTYANYVLVLKSDIPTVVLVDTVLEKYPDNIQQQNPSVQSTSMQSSLNNNNIRLLIGILVMLGVVYYAINMRQNGSSVPRREPTSLLQKLQEVPLE